MHTFRNDADCHRTCLGSKGSGMLFRPFCLGKAPNVAEEPKNYEITVRLDFIELRRQRTLNSPAIPTNRLTPYPEQLIVPRLGRVTFRPDDGARYPHHGDSAGLHPVSETR
jgi:hypothetical protein